MTNPATREPAEPVGVRRPGGQDPAAKRRRRAWLILFGGAAVVAALVVGGVLLLRSPEQTSSGPSSTALSTPAPSSEWDTAAEAALATRPMLDLPDVAAAPHELTTATAGDPLTLPKPTQTADRWIPGGFPATAEGALAQLAVLTEAGLSGADAQTYAKAYRSVALPGAPPAETSRLFGDLQRLRAKAGLPPTGVIPGFTVTYKASAGQIKGTTDGGRYAVVCVLGEVTAGYQGRAISGGAGDCQAMRYVAGEWRISPGPSAARAPLAWPGTAEAVAAGYRAVS